MVVFAGIGEALFGHLPSLFVLAVAAFGWAATAAALYALVAFFVPDACDENQD